MIYNDPNSFLEDKKLFVRLMLPILHQMGPEKFKELLKKMLAASTIGLMPDFFNEEDFRIAVLSLRPNQLKYN